MFCVQFQTELCYRHRVASIKIIPNNERNDVHSMEHIIFSLITPQTYNCRKAFMFIPYIKSEK